MRDQLGFTGTQIGMTAAQKATFREFLSAGSWEVFRHGDCVGADAEAHTIARERGLYIVVHPPLADKKRAFCGGDLVTVLPPKDYLKRNHDIVNVSKEMVATPKLKSEEVRSGTWATIRYAVKVGKIVTIIWPDGTTTVMS